MYTFAQAAVRLLKQATVLMKCGLSAGAAGMASSEAGFMVYGLCCSSPHSRPNSTCCF